MGSNHCISYQLNIIDHMADTHNDGGECMGDGALRWKKKAGRNTITLPSSKNIVTTVLEEEKNAHSTETSQTVEQAK
jgi:hypothetical protein